MSIPLPPLLFAFLLYSPTTPTALGFHAWQFTLSLWEWHEIEVGLPGYEFWLPDPYLLVV